MQERSATDGRQHYAGGQHDPRGQSRDHRHPLARHVRPRVVQVLQNVNSEKHLTSIGQDEEGCQGNQVRNPSVAKIAGTDSQIR